MEDEKKLVKALSSESTGSGKHLTDTNTPIRDPDKDRKSPMQEIPQEGNLPGSCNSAPPPLAPKVRDESKDGSPDHSNCKLDGTDSKSTPKSEPPDFKDGVSDRQNEDQVQTRGKSMLKMGMAEGTSRLSSTSGPSNLKDGVSPSKDRLSPNSAAAAAPWGKMRKFMVQGGHTSQDTNQGVSSKGARSIKIVGVSGVVLP